MGLYLLHICEGERVVGDAGSVHVSDPASAIATGILVAKELANDLRFALSAVVVTDDMSKVLARVPVWEHARARQGLPDDDCGTPEPSPAA